MSIRRRQRSTCEPPVIAGSLCKLVEKAPEIGPHRPPFESDQHVNFPLLRGRLFGCPSPGFLASSGGSGERGEQAVAGPQILFGHEVGEERVDFGQDGGALSGPVCDEVVGCGVVGAHVAVRAGADEGARDLGQTEAESITVPGANELQQVNGDALPVADGSASRRRRPVRG